MADFINSLHPILVCLLVCGSKILEISIQSVKTVLLVKGERFKAAFLGFLECVVWGLVISSIIATLGNNIFLLFFYCLGYATGLLIGSYIESKVAVGTCHIQLIANEENTDKIVEYLKENEKGFTVFEGEGAKGKNNMIFVVVSRKETKKVLKDIRVLCENQVFEVTTDVNKYVGGYGIKK